MGLLLLSLLLLLLRYWRRSGPCLNLFVMIRSEVSGFVWMECGRRS
jgi:hypothetical protein